MNKQQHFSFLIIIVSLFCFKAQQIQLPNNQKWQWGCSSKEQANFHNLPLVYLQSQWLLWHSQCLDWQVYLLAGDSQIGIYMQKDKGTEFNINIFWWFSKPERRWQLKIRNRAKNKLGGMTKCQYQLNATKCQYQPNWSHSELTEQCEQNCI